MIPPAVRETYMRALVFGLEVKSRRVREFDKSIKYQMCSEVPGERGSYYVYGWIKEDGESSSTKMRRK